MIKSTATFFQVLARQFVERCSHGMFLLVRDLRVSLRLLLESLLESDVSQSTRASTRLTISLSKILLETNFCLGRIGPVRYKETDDLAPHNI